MKKILAVMFVFAFLLMPMHEVRAEGAEYKFTVYAGNLGQFSDGTTEKTYTITEGDNFTLSLSDLGVSVSDERYHPRGLKIAGHDSDTEPLITSKNFEGVNEDMSFVVAYGLKADMVKYTIKYIGPNGESLAADDEYYGMVDDEPVVAARYIEGYTPLDSNKTGKLVRDGENVFEFHYIVTPRESTTIYQEVPGEGGGGRGSGGGGGTTPTPGPEPTPEPTPGPDEPVIPDEPTPITPPGPDEPVIPDDPTPQTDPTGGGSILPWAAGGVVAGAGFLWGLLAFLKRKKKENEEEA